MASEPRTINDPGVERPLQPKATHEMLDVYVDPGGTLIDTADDFGFGTSERIVGRCLSSRPGARERVPLAAKGHFGYPGASLTPAYLRTAIGAGHFPLGTDHVDLYQFRGGSGRSSTY